MNCDTATIILAEDNAADIMLVREALKKHQIDCLLNVINDGAEVIAFLDSLNNCPQLYCFDLLLLDMHLPKRDGEEILKKLRSIEHYAETPVIVMSGSLSPQFRATAEKHRALHYFPKPSNLSEFMELGVLIGDILKTKQSGRTMEGEEQRSTAAA